jgi:hypothetical protein
LSILGWLVRSCGAQGSSPKQRKQKTFFVRTKKIE